MKRQLFDKSETACIILIGVKRCWKRIFFLTYKTPNWGTGAHRSHLIEYRAGKWLAHDTWIDHVLKYASKQH